MAQDCYLCKNKTIFFIWSTSRNFPRDKLIKAKKLSTRYEIGLINKGGVPVCFSCFHKLNKKSDE